MATGGRRTAWPDELVEWLVENIPGRHTADLLKLQHEAFPDRPLNESQLHNFKTRKGIRSGLPSGIQTGTPSSKFPQPVADYIRDNHVGVGPTEMTERLNEMFGAHYQISQLVAFYKNHHYRSGVDTRWKDGHEAWNKGKPMTVTEGMRRHQFKPGHVPYSTREVGTVVEREGGYKWKKVGPGRFDWKQLHRLVWEEANGPLPDNQVVIFLDGDPRNVALGNLMAVDKNVHQMMNRKSRRRSDPELTRTYVNITKLESLLHSRRKK